MTDDPFPFRVSEAEQAVDQLLEDRDWAPVAEVVRDLEVQGHERSHVSFALLEGVAHGRYVVDQRRVVSLVGQGQRERSVDVEMEADLTSSPT